MSYDLTLQQNNITQKFILLSNEEKLKCIELGLSLFENGKNKMYSMNNEEWQEKLNIMKQEINNEKEKCSKLIINHKKELEELSQQIRNSCQVSFENEINLLKNKNDSLCKQLQETSEKIYNIQQTTTKELETKYETKLEKEQKQLEQQREKYETKLENLRNQYEEKLEKEREKTEIQKQRKTNSTLKGQDGETSMEHLLNRMFPKAEIRSYTSKEGHRGDFSILEGDMNIMVETKNYSKNVPKVEITKFHRDMKENQEYTCGIFCSQKSGISKKDDFSLEISNGRPVVYLHNLDKDPEKLKYAVSLFRMLLSMENLDINNQEILEIILQRQGSVSKAYSNMKIMINKFKEDFLKTMEVQEKEILDIFDLINKKNIN